MSAFNFYIPTRIQCGSGLAKSTGKLLLPYGIKKLLIVTDPGLRSTFVVETVLQSLQDEGIAYEIFSDVEANPSTDVFNGILDEVALFKRALSTAEIGAIYNSGKSGLCKPPEFVDVALESDRTVTLSVTGPVGKPVTLSQSADLSVWSVLETKDNPEGVLDFSVPGASPRMFFRVQLD